MLYLQIQEDLGAPLSETPLVLKSLVAPAGTGGSALHWSSAGAEGSCCVPRGQKPPWLSQQEQLLLWREPSKEHPVCRQGLFTAALGGDSPALLLESALTIQEDPHP